MRGAISWPSAVPASQVNMLLSGKFHTQWMTFVEKYRDPLPAALGLCRPQGPGWLGKWGPRGGGAGGLTLCCVPNSLAPTEAPCPPGSGEEPDDSTGQLDTVQRDLKFVTTAAVAFPHTCPGMLVFTSTGTPSIKSCSERFCVSVCDADAGAWGAEGGPKRP